ncbi:hypothetical protein QBC44DRAFT_305998 [Cladorrhinum sp. PSN332]|nr:hypothetical protein QBC44DRAFT_305998 [Cladorrhinum sp. PSN332]
MHRFPQAGVAVYDGDDTAAGCGVEIDPSLRSRGGVYASDVSGSSPPSQPYGQANGWGWPRRCPIPFDHKNAQSIDARVYDLARCRADKSFSSFSPMRLDAKTAGECTFSWGSYPPLMSRDVLGLQMPALFNHCCRCTCPPNEVIDQCRAVSQKVDRSAASISRSKKLLRPYLIVEVARATSLPSDISRRWGKRQEKSQQELWGQGKPGGKPGCKELSILGPASLTRV